MSAMVSVSSAEELAVLVQRHARLGQVGATVAVGEEVIGAISDPLDRALELARGDGCERIFAIEEDLGAEPAADIRRDDADLILSILRMSCCRMSR